MWLPAAQYDNGNARYAVARDGKDHLPSQRVWDSLRRAPAAARPSTSPRSGLQALAVEVPCDDVTSQAIVAQRPGAV